MKPQLTAKQREAGMVKELEKEDFYGKKKTPVKAIVRTKMSAAPPPPKSEKPLSAKEREAGMISELGKEDFYGNKKVQERADRMAKDAIKEMKNERIVERFKKSAIMRYKKK
jgi:hypothetical protein